MRTVAILGVLLLAGVASAADVSTLDGMVKQGQKIGTGDAAKMKSLCICHFADGSARLGHFGTFPSSFPVDTQVHAQCYVPTYGPTGSMTMQESCVGGAGGNRWEIAR